MRGSNISIAIYLWCGRPDMPEAVCRFAWHYVAVMLRLPVNFELHYRGFDRRSSEEEDFG